MSLAILPVDLHTVDNPYQEEALQAWKSLSQNPLNIPTNASACHQKNWDTPLIKECVSSLLSVSNPRDRIRLLAAQQKEADAWLSAPPTSALGLRLCDDSLRIAVGLRLGSPLCTPHLCPLCGSHIDASGVHALRCRSSKGRLPRHTALNSIIHKALVSANIPSTLEPRGLSRTDGKRPDGLTITPWSRGRALVWDVTCWDSFAPSNLTLSSTQAGKLADAAAIKKRETYQEMATCHHFQPISFETTGAFGRDALDFIRDLIKRIRQISHDPLSYLKICQRISMCIQSFNAVSILGCSVSAV